MTHMHREGVAHVSVFSLQARGTIQYYEDDGISFDYQRGAYLLQKVTAVGSPNGVDIDIASPEGTFRPPKRALVLKIHSQSNQPSVVNIGGVRILQQESA